MVEPVFLLFAYSSTPLLWVVMAAAAISTNAGSMRPFIDAYHVSLGNLADSAPTAVRNLETRH